MDHIVKGLRTVTMQYVQIVAALTPTPVPAPCSLFPSVKAVTPLT